MSRNDDFKLGLRRSLDPNKPTILICSDSAAIHTGLARVVRSIFKRIKATDRYNIIQQGWFHVDPSEPVPWPIFSTEQHPENKRLLERDKYGAYSLPRVLGEIRPDIVFAFHDPWNLKHFAEIQNKSFYLIAYTCIDSEPMPIQAKPIFEEADTLVTFGNWAKSVISRDSRFHPKEVVVIPHGVDTAVFRPLDDDKIRQDRKNLANFDENDFVFGCVARNQARKNLGRLVQFCHYMVNGFYALCKKCDQVTLFDVDHITCKVRTKPSCCMHCKSTEIVEAEYDKHIHVYYHGSVSESIGWDIPELVRRYGLEGNFHFNADIKPHAGVSDEELNRILNCFDVFTMPTTAEGFGLPILESMSAGVPVLLPDYSAYMEWADQSGLFVNTEKYIEPGLNSTRAQILMHDWIRKARLMRSPAQLITWSENARKKALEMHWDDISIEFDRLFSRCLRNPMESKLRLTRI